MYIPEYKTQVDKHILDIMDMEMCKPPLITTLPKEIRKEIEKECYGKVECAAEILLEYIPLLKPEVAVKILIRLVQHLLDRIDNLEATIAVLEMEIENRERKIQFLREEKYTLERTVDALESQIRKLKKPWYAM